MRHVTLLGLVFWVGCGGLDPQLEEPLSVDEAALTGSLRATLSHGLTQVALTSQDARGVRHTELSLPGGRVLARFETDLMTYGQSGELLGQALAEVSASALSSPDGELIRAVANSARELAESQPGRYEEVSEQLGELSRLVSALASR